MSNVSQVPTPAKAILEENQLQRYHGAMRPWFDQVQELLGGLTLADNLGAVVSPPAQVTAGADGVLTGVFLPCSFYPLLVFWRAEVLDSASRPTSVFSCGFCQWNTTPRGTEQGLNLTKAVGLLPGAYSVTFLALPG